MTIFFCFENSQATHLRYFKLFCLFCHSKCKKVCCSNHIAKRPPSSSWAKNSLVSLSKPFSKMHFLYTTIIFTVWSEGFLYKVTLPELKISPIMHFVIYNLVLLFKILKIVVPFWSLFAYVNHYQNKQFYIVKISFFKILL